MRIWYNHITFMKQMKALWNVVKRLRKECPWDRKQTHRTLIPCLREESKEFERAILSGNKNSMCEEAGDVLLQVLIHAVIAEERGKFKLEDVARRLKKKLVRRHPHVFGKKRLNTPEEVLRQWAAIKKKEKKRKPK